MQLFITCWTDLGSKINMNCVALFFLLLFIIRGLIHYFKILLMVLKVLVKTVFNMGFYLTSYGKFFIQRQKCNEIMKLCLNWILHWLHQTPKMWVGSLSKEEYTQFLAHQKRGASSFASTSELGSASHCLLCSIFDPWVIGV